MVAIARLLLLASTVAAAATRQLFHRDVKTVINDINMQIAPIMTQLDKDVKNFPESGFCGSLDIDTDAKNLVSALNTATANVESTGKVGVAAAITITGLESRLLQMSTTLDRLGSLAYGWKAIPGGAVHVFDNLQVLQAAFDKYLDAISAAVPATQAVGVAAIKKYLTSSFDKAIRIYSTA
ncbi:hypothetical protein GGI43DRAFT_382928 [Trichoderma evansii]